MKIALLTIADLGKKKNFKTRDTLPIIDAIQKLGAQYHIFARDYKDYPDKNISKILPFGNVIPRICEGISKFLPFFHGRKIYLWMMDYIMSKKDLSQFDLLICVPASYPKTAQKIQKQGGNVLVYEAANHPKIIQKYNKNNPFDNLKLRTLENADFVMTLSPFTRDGYLDNGWAKQNVYMVPIGVNINKFKPGDNNDDKFRVLCVANYDEYKGIQYLLKAWEKLNLPNSKLVIVGNPRGKMKKLVKKYKEKLSNFDQIDFTHDILGYYQKSSVFVLPSLLEGSARVVYEAMACGLPVICTYESGSVVRDGQDGFIIPTQDVEALSKKILYMYKNPEKAKQMGQNAKKIIKEKYQWKNFTDRVYEVLLDIKNNG